MILFLLFLTTHAWVNTDTCGTVFQPSGTITDRRNLVVNGQDAQPCDFPWQAGLRQKSNDGEGDTYCGASIISDEWILTAAHCMGIFDLDAVEVWVGDYKLADSSDNEHFQTRDIDAELIHEEYGSTVEGKDIGLIHLKTPLNLGDCVVPVCLPQQGDVYPYGETVLTSGWGNVDDMKNLRSIRPDQHLQYFENTVHQPTYCEAATSISTPESWCANSFASNDYPSTSVGICQGDSGGPSVMKNGDGRYVQVGISSFVLHCGSYPMPDYFQGISRHVDWIDRKVDEFVAPIPAPEPTPTVDPNPNPYTPTTLPVNQCQVDRFTMNGWCYSSNDDDDTKHENVESVEDCNALCNEQLQNHFQVCCEYQPEYKWCTISPTGKAWSSNSMASLAQLCLNTDKSPDCETVKLVATSPGDTDVVSLVMNWDAENWRYTDNAYHISCCANEQKMRIHDNVNEFCETDDEGQVWWDDDIGCNWNAMMSTRWTVNWSEASTYTATCLTTPQEKDTCETQDPVYVCGAKYRGDFANSAICTYSVETVECPPGWTACQNVNGIACENRANDDPWEACWDCFMMKYSIRDEEDYFCLHGNCEVMDWASIPYFQTYGATTYEEVPQAMANSRLQVGCLAKETCSECLQDSNCKWLEGAEMCSHTHYPVGQDSVIEVNDIGQCRENLDTLYYYAAQDECKTFLQMDSVQFRWGECSELPETSYTERTYECNWVENNWNSENEISQGNVESYDECIQLVKENCPDATIANVQKGGEGGCFCQFGTDMRSAPGHGWENCLISQSTETVTIDPEEPRSLLVNCVSAGVAEVSLHLESNCQGDTISWFEGEKDYNDNCFQDPEEEEQIYFHLSWTGCQPENYIRSFEWGAAEPKVAPFHLCSNNSLQKLKDYDAFTETNLYGFSCLYLAVRKQNKEMFKILNEVEDDDKILLNHKTTGSQGTALHLASVSHHSHWFVVRLARRSGIDCNAQNKFLSTPLMQAVEINSYWYTKALTENCPSVDVTVQGNNGNTALHQAIYKKSGEVFDMICSHAKATGQSLDTTNNQGKTALHLAVDRFNVDQVRSLMTNGADANIANTHGGLPLYNHWHNPTGKLIDQEGLIEMATLMLENGADPTIKSWPNLMRSAFSRFAFGSRPDELKAKYFELLIVLLKSGADINDMSGGQNGIFCKMINSGKVQAVRRIIEENLVDVDHQCWKGARKYPLHLAILGKKDEIAKILIDAGANIRLRDAYGARPIDIARNKHKEFFAEHFAGMRRN